MRIAIILFSIALALATNCLLMELYDAQKFKKYNNIIFKSNPLLVGQLSDLAGVSCNQYYSIWQLLDEFAYLLQISVAFSMNCPVLKGRWTCANL